MRIVLAGTAMVMLLATSASTQAPKTTSDPTRALFLPAAEIAATRAKLQDVAYANTTVLERADGERLGYRLAVDRRRPPQRGASHATEAELWAIIDGSGVITTGGKIVETMKDGKVVDRHIQGGIQHKVTKGDFLFIPEGVPHEVTGFTPEIVMVTLEIPRPAAGTR
jgi:mannose-6-phosphate isomerase-like protein (cupin superfamily)